MARAVPPTVSFSLAVQKQMAGSEIRPESRVKTLPRLSEHVETIYQMNGIRIRKLPHPDIFTLLFRKATAYMHVFPWPEGLSTRR